jgi:hypothetical protein
MQKEVVDRLSPEHKAEIIDYLFAAQINHYQPSSEFLTNARWQFNTEMVYGPWLDRLLTGRNTGNHVFTQILSSRNENELRRFINENIDSIIQNGIAIRTVKYPLIIQRALSLCVGYACSMLLQEDPTIAFTLLSSLPARELLRKEHPFIFGFRSNFN